MPRIKDFQKLPTWLQDYLKADWAAVCGGPAPHQPPISDPEYRVYRVDGSDLWYHDAGTGGVIVHREGEAYNYDDLPADSPVRAAVDAEGRRCRDAEAVETLFGLIRSHGVDARPLATMLLRMREDGLSDAAVARELAGMVYDGLRHGAWNVPRGNDR